MRRLPGLFATGRSRPSALSRASGTWYGSSPSWPSPCFGWACSQASGLSAARIPTASVALIANLSGAAPSAPQSKRGVDLPLRRDDLSPLRRGRRGVHPVHVNVFERPMVLAVTRAPVGCMAPAAEERAQPSSLGCCDVHVGEGLLNRGILRASGCWFVATNRWRSGDRRRAKQRLRAAADLHSSQRCSVSCEKPIRSMADLTQRLIEAKVVLCKEQ